MRTIWITGAAGFIGTMLSSLLVREGDRCFGLDVRAAEGSSIEAAQFVTGVVSEASLAALLDLSGAPDAVFEELEQTFSAHEIVALTLAIVAINGWNRLAISMRTPVGSYVSPHHQTGA